MRISSSFWALFISLFISICSVLPLHSQDSTECYLLDPDGRIRQHNADFMRMALDVKFNTKEGKVIGDVVYDFRPIQYVMDTLFLDAPGIYIKKVSLDGKEVTYSTDSAGLTIKFFPPVDWNKQYKLEINYEATPRKGLYFIGWDVDAKNTAKDEYFTRKQIWTQGQGTDNRFWFPSYDDVNDKLVTETTITFDSAYTVISNGLLKDKNYNADGTTTWHYAMSKPIVPYMVMIAIDKYAYKDYKSQCGVVSREYYYADRPQTVIPTYQYSAEMMDFLVDQTGVPYPWETYANVPVQDFMYGAMENTTATIYTDALLNDARTVLERPYVSVNAHELTHHWFGDCLTEYSGRHHWLHESFATYYSKQFMRHIYGEDTYEFIKRAEANAAIAADKTDRFPIGHSHAGGSRVYPKGSFVLDMLRYVVGDSVFKRCITGYVEKHAYQNVTNQDFMMAFMENAGINLDWFFDEWIYHAGFPEYEVSYQRQADRVAFFVAQKQKKDELQPYFKMPIVFEVHFKDGSASIKTSWISQAADTVYLNAPAAEQVDYVLFDPGSNVLKVTDFKKGLAELEAQAEKAINFNDKLDALIALRDTSLEQKRDLLIRIFDKGNYNVLQHEIIAQLSKDTTSRPVISLFKRALHDKDFLVRRAVLSNLAVIPNELLSYTETLLDDSSYFTIEEALRILCKLHPEKTTGYLEKTKNIRGFSDNVRIAWLEIRNKQKIPVVAEMDNRKYFDELTAYASNRYEFRTRLKAIDALEHADHCDAKVIANLFNAALYANSRLSNPAGKALKTTLKKPENLKIAQAVFAAGKWKDWQRKTLERFLKP